MIAPRDYTTTKRILTLGLQNQEQKLVDKIADKLSVQMETAHSDMDLFDHAQAGNYDLIVLGQSDDISDPSYLIWLVKGVSYHCKFILLYDSLPTEEERRVENYHVYWILHRPINAKQFYDSIYSALYAPHRVKNIFQSIVSGLNPKHWYAKQNTTYG